MDEFFKDMIHEGHLDASNKLHLECIWFCFKNLIQNELNGVMEEWNNHYIRKSRFQTASGIPNNLFFLPESVGATDRKHPYNREDIEEINNELRIPENDDSLIYQDFFPSSRPLTGNLRMLAHEFVLIFLAICKWYRNTMVGRGEKPTAGTCWAPVSN